MAYPVLAEASLPPVLSPRSRSPLTWLARRCREPEDLPALEPGSVYVFRAHGTYHCVADGHPDLDAPVVVDATEVVVVTLRPRTVVAQLRVPSLNVRRDFTVRVEFRCRVTDPIPVAAAGLTDLDAVLTAHLLDHDEIAHLARAYASGARHELRRVITAHVVAYWAVAPLELPGLEVGLGPVDVLETEEP